MSESSKALFLSYASEDADAALRIYTTLRATGIEVWFDQSELRGGDTWDQKIRREIRDCALFVPIISRNTQARTEGYFRLEWRLADDRTRLMSKSRVFLVPVCIDDTRVADADVPDSFAVAQWTRLPHDDTLPAFAERIAALLDTPVPASGVTTGTVAPPNRSRTACVVGDSLDPHQRVLNELLVSDGAVPTANQDVLNGAASHAAVETLQQYALQRWAWWERSAGGHVYSRFVPLAVEPTARGTPFGLQVPSGPLTSIVELLDQCDITGAGGYLLRGPPGAGKTTLLRHHEQVLCRQALRQIDKRDPPSEVPLYVPLSALPRDEKDPVKWLREWVRQVQPHCKTLHDLLRPAAERPISARMRLRLLLDGLNELKVPAGSSREQHAQQVTSALWAGLRPDLPMLMSTRTQHDVNLSDRNGFFVLPVNVLPWSDVAIGMYLELRFRSQEIGNRHLSALIKHGRALELCRVPMHLDGQCELIEALSNSGSDATSALMSDRASLYNAWLWHRLRRELKIENGEAVNPDMYDDDLLPAVDRRQILSDTGWPHTRLHLLEWKGRLLPTLFQQALRQWRHKAKEGVPAQQRGEVEVTWSETRAELEESASVSRAPAWADRWGEVVEALGLARINKDSKDSFKFSHQTWGEYLAACALLPPKPEDWPEHKVEALLTGLARKPFAMTATQDLERRHHLVTESWRKVPANFLETLLTEGMTLKWSAVRRSFADDGWPKEQIDRWRQAYAGANPPVVVVDKAGDTCFLNFRALGDQLNSAKIGTSLSQPWFQRPEAWKRLLVEVLWSPFKHQVKEQLSQELDADAVDELFASADHLNLAPAGHLDEVAELALQALVDPWPWLRRVCLAGHWRICSRAIVAVRPRLLSDPRADQLIQHLRRMLLLLSIDSGSVRRALPHKRGWRMLSSWLRGWGDARDSLSAGGVLAALTCVDIGFDDEFERQWKAAWSASFKGSGIDLRMRLEAGLLLGELGDTLRYQERTVQLPGELHSRKGLTLRAQHWVGVGVPGQSTLFQIGDNAGEQNERPASDVPFAYFQIASYQVTWGEWRGFCDSHGYDDPEAVWWQRAGPLAQQWLRERLAAAAANNVDVRPWGWDKPSFNNPLQPVVGITAYEALAYCHWVEELYKDREAVDDLKPGLPSEAHREAAVRGAACQLNANQRWPAVSPELTTGTELPSPLLFNHVRTGWGRPSPVGVFSLSNTSSGIADAAGNAWEWCSNETTIDYRENRLEKILTSTSSIWEDVQTQLGVRGVGFNGPAEWGRPSWRGARPAGFVGTGIGMRLARLRPPHGE